MQYFRFMRKLLIGVMVPWLLSGCSHSSSPPTPSPTPEISASASLGAGTQYLNQARAAFAKKDFQEASIQGDLAAEILKNESAPLPQRIEAHRIAGQSYFKRKDYPKALHHYQALQRLDPKNKQYATVTNQIASRIPKSAPGKDAPDDAYFQHRDEHRHLASATPGPPPSIDKGQHSYPTAKTPEPDPADTEMVIIGVKGKSKSKVKPTPQEEKPFPGN